MPTQTKHEHHFADLNAVREFLLSGREIPPAPKPGRRGQRSVSDVPLSVGIGRARGRSGGKS